MNIFHVTTECFPFTNSTSLSKAISEQVNATQKLVNEAMVIMPLYKNIKDNYSTTFLGHTNIYIGEYEKYVGLHHLSMNNVSYFFIDNEEYFYHDRIDGYANDGERFVFFDEAVLASLNILKIYPDVLHLHNWQTGLIPHFLKAKYKYQMEYQKIKTVLTIHDIYQQGVFPREMETIIDIANTPLFYLDGNINFLKAGIMEADFVTTTSPSYAEMTKDSNNHLPIRFSLIDRADEYQGILNGINYDYYNPGTDTAIFANFSSSDIIKGKSINKRSFRSEVDLPDIDCMLVGFTSPLTADNGLDIITNCMEKIINETDVQFFFLGDGEQKYIDYLEYLTHKYPDRFKCFIGENDEIARKICAASDMVINLSNALPTDSSEIIAMRYGAIPLVHEAGCLKDIVLAYNQYSGEGNGFSFINQTVEDFLKVFDLAYGLYRFNQPEWYKLMKRCNRENYSWEKCITNYLDIYQKILA